MQNTLHVRLMTIPTRNLQ